MAHYISKTVSKPFEAVVAMERTGNPVLEPTVEEVRRLLTVAVSHVGL